jgi:ketosteroid isomerase-like protein
MNRKGVVKSIEFPELKVGLAGNNAVARHLWVSESEADGKPTSTKIGILSVWTKQDGAWKLLARQGYKLAT